MISHRQITCTLDLQDAPPRHAGRIPAHLPLHHFLRLIAGAPHLMEQGAAGSNDDLVSNLLRSGVISDENVAAALRICSRDIFVPDNYREDAFVDAPIRLEDLGINLSAPHMHATMLEALDVRPGMSILDVGTGCGVVAAACALLTGRQGIVVGIDIRRECCSMARTNVETLSSNSSVFIRDATPKIHFECLNAFLLAGTPHIGAYDRIHVGASCPPERLNPFLKLLKPHGGLIVVPVAPSDLRIIIRQSNGTLAQKVISQVRFSDIEVPSDAEIVLAALRAERKSRMIESVPASTFDADMAAIASTMRWNGALTKQQLSSSPAGVLDQLPPSPYGPGSPLADVLGQPDCALAASDWAIPVHSAVLCQRCELLRARAKSGMADATFTSVVVPEHFSRRSIDLFVQYLYHDTLECGPEEAAEVIHVAQYFGVPRLVQLCEGKLARMLKSAARSDRAVENAAETAASLLALAHNQQLPHLQSVAVDFVVSHHNIVSSTDAYASLSRDQINVVASEACRQLSTAKGLLKDINRMATEGFPEL